MIKKIMIIIMMSLAFVGCQEKAKVGDIEYSHWVYYNESYEDVYVIVRENGQRVYILERYINSSIDTYKEHGTYGKEVIIKQ